MKEPVESDNELSKTYKSSSNLWNSLTTFFFLRYRSKQDPFKQPQLEEIIIKTKNILNKYGTIESYFGHSKCRICNNYNEYSEYSISYNNITYIIPFGYFHYLEMHNVKIDSKLVEIVQYFEGLQFEI